MRLLLTAVLLCLASAAPAGAATVKHWPGGCVRGECSSTSVTVTASAGEQNDIRVTAEPGSVLIEDAGADLTGDCAAVGLRARRCPVGAESFGVTVELGDGDDRLVATPGDSVSVRGGDGNDDLTAQYVDGGSGNDQISLVARANPKGSGGPGDDVLVGSLANDILIPGPGRDEVRAGEGHDLVVDDDAAEGQDILDGGAGFNTISFEGRDDGVDVDLATQVTSDSDAVSGFAHVVGGAGDDLLVGDGGRNQLRGEEGHDRLVGGDGADWLDGGAGFDRFDGGAGDDAISAFGTEGVGHLLDASPEPVHCGPGVDRVTTGGDLLFPDCERLPFGVRVADVRVQDERSLVAFAVRCPKRFLRRGRCRVEVAAAEADDGFFAARRATVRAGRRTRLRVDPDLAVPGRPVVVRVRFRGRLGWRGVTWVVPGPGQPLTPPA